MHTTMDLKMLGIYGPSKHSTLMKLNYDLVQNVVEIKKSSTY
jgi:hypothetical protein